MYVHPDCKFDASCTKAACPFTHSAKKAAPPQGSRLPPVVLQPITSALLTIPLMPSRLAIFTRIITSFAFLVPFMFPPRMPGMPRQPRPMMGRMGPSEVPCRFFPRCTNLECPFKHPKVFSLIQNISRTTFSNYNVVRFVVFVALSIWHVVYEQVDVSLRSPCATGSVKASLDAALKHYFECNKQALVRCSTNDCCCVSHQPDYKVSSTHNILPHQ